MYMYNTALGIFGIVTSELRMHTYITQTSAIRTYTVHVCVHFYYKRHILYMYNLKTFPIQGSLACLAPPQFFVV